MSGIEVAGLVLGAFPILLNCLDYYQKGFEPLEEWWNFRTNFIAFIDDISHQMMKYTENMFQLLDPIIADRESLIRLIEDPDDQRWHDAKLGELLKDRLASEYSRYFRTVDKIHRVICELQKLMKVQNGKAGGFRKSL